jgi:hypothetical protein
MWWGEEVIDRKPAIAEARMAAANLRAGPRDTVIRVRRKVF